jgi:hypothetical protein
MQTKDVLFSQSNEYSQEATAEFVRIKRNEFLYYFGIGLLASLGIDNIPRKQEFTYEGVITHDLVMEYDGEIDKYLLLNNSGTPSPVVTSKRLRTLDLAHLTSLIPTPEDELGDPGLNSFSPSMSSNLNSPPSTPTLNADGNPSRTSLGYSASETRRNSVIRCKSTTPPPTPVIGHSNAEDDDHRADLESLTFNPSVPCVLPDVLPPVRVRKVRFRSRIKNYLLSRRTTWPEAEDMV